MRSFTCIVTSPYADKLAAAGGPLEGRNVWFRLRWEAPDVASLEPSPDLAAADAAIRDGLAELFAPIPQVLFPAAPSRRLARHVFRFVHDPPPEPGHRVVEARARDVEEPLRRQVFTLGPDGAVVAERAEGADGHVSEYRLGLRPWGERFLVIDHEGWFRGARVGLHVDWGTVVGGRPVPTRLVVRQYDDSGKLLPGGLGEMEFHLRDHALEP